MKVLHWHSVSGGLRGALAFPDGRPRAAATVNRRDRSPRPARRNVVLTNPPIAIRARRAGEKRPNQKGFQKDGLVLVLSINTTAEPLDGEYAHGVGIFLYRYGVDVRHGSTMLYVYHAACRTSSSLTRCPCLSSGRDPYPGRRGPLTLCRVLWIAHHEE